MTKTSKIALTALAGAAVLSLVPGVQAVPITGFVNFDGGQMTFGPGETYTTATEITGFTGTTTVTAGLSQTGGAYVGTAGDVVTFEGTPISLSIGGTSASNPVWTYFDATTGYTYSFNLASITSVLSSSSGIVVSGDGQLLITGAGSPYDATAGTWSLSSTSSSGVQFNFDSAGSAVPDGGTTASLLGGALIGLGLLKRKLMA